MYIVYWVPSPTLVAHPLYINIHHSFQLFNLQGTPPSRESIFLVFNENVYYLEDEVEPKTYLVETKDEDKEDYLPKPGTVSLKGVLNIL